MSGMSTGSAEMSDGMAAAGGVMSSGGQGGLLEVIQARQSATRLGEQAAQVREQRAAALARLNALLGRSGDTPLSGAAMPGRIARAAVAASAAQVRFESAALGAPAADSPIPPLADLEGAAHMESPELLAHASMLAAQGTRVELARRSRLPDVDVSIEYGQRDRMPDMVSARVALPLPVQRSRRQDQAVAEAQADLAALEAEHEDRVARLHADVGRLYATLERDRSQLALYVKAILPQGRAAVDAAAAALQSGRGSLSGALTAQSALFEYELAYQRALTDFAKTLAELERVVGREVLHDR
jgi:outer membrane protein TolC